MRRPKKGVVLSGDALVHARTIKNNWTQEGLAAALNFNVEQIQRAEREEPILPRFAHAIAEILGVPLEDLEKKNPVGSTNTPPQKEEDPASPSPRISVTITQLSDGTWTVQSQRKIDKDHAALVKAHGLSLLKAVGLLLGLEDGYNEDDMTVTPDVAVHSVDKRANFGEIDHTFLTDRATGAKQMNSHTAGSLIVTVPLSRRDTALVMNAFIAGELEQFKVASVTVSTSPIQESQLIALKMLLSKFLAGGSRPSSDETQWQSVYQQIDDFSAVLASLDHTQMQVLRLMLEGTSVITIADRLKMGVRDVQVRRRSILDKMKKADSFWELILQMID